MPKVRPEDYAATLDLAYRGLWGHKLVAADAEPPPGAVVVGLYERDEPVGLATIFPADRLVDGPGVRSGSRTTDAYVRLLLGACAELDAGPIDVESWGDDPAVTVAYEHLGFEVVEHTAGWQRRHS